MKKIILLTAPVLVLQLLTACGRPPSIDEAAPSIDEVRADFCQALAGFSKALVNVREIDQNSTVGELKETERVASSAWDTLTQAAGTLRDAKFTELEQAFGNLERIINDIPDDATLAEAQEKVRLAILETTAQYADIATTVCVYGQEAEAVQ